MQIDATSYSAFSTPPAERRADPAAPDDNFGRRLADEIQEHRPAPAERAEANPKEASPEAPPADAAAEPGNERMPDIEPPEVEAAAEPIEPNAAPDTAEAVVRADPVPVDEDTPAVAAAPGEMPPVDDAAVPPVIEDDLPVAAVTETTDEDAPDPAPASAPAVRGLVQGHLHGEDGALAPTGRPDAPEGSGAERAGGLALQVGRELSALLGRGETPATAQPDDTAEAQAQAQAQADAKPTPRRPVPAVATGTAPNTAFEPGSRPAATGPGTSAPAGNDATAIARAPAATAAAIPARTPFDAGPSLPEMLPPQPVGNLPGTTAAPAQPTAAAAAPQAAAHHPAAQQVAIHIARAAESGLDRVRIQLNPPELGRVDVRLEIAQDGRVQAVLSTERPDTLELLRRDVHGLEKALAEAGLKTDSGSLSFSLEGGEDQPNRLDTAATDTPYDQDEADDAPPSLAEAARRWIVTDGALDIRV